MMFGTQINDTQSSQPFLQTIDISIGDTTINIAPLFESKSIDDYDWDRWNHGGNILQLKPKWLSKIKTIVNW